MLLLVLDKALLVVQILLVLRLKRILRIVSEQHARRLASLNPAARRQLLPRRGFWNVEALHELQLFRSHALGRGHRWRD